MLFGTFNVVEVLIFLRAACHQALVQATQQNHYVISSFIDLLMILPTMLCTCDVNIGMLLIVVYHRCKTGSNRVVVLVKYRSGLTLGPVEVQQNRESQWMVTETVEGMCLFYYYFLIENDDSI